jgi:lipid-A-disaccharide synthase
LPLFEQLAKANPDLQFLIAGISDWKELYHTDIPVLFDQTYDVVKSAEVAIVTSGTATLETALLETPQIVVYKTDWVFYSLAKIVIQIIFFLKRKAKQKKKSITPIILNHRCCLYSASFHYSFHTNIFVCVSNLVVIAT